jgi:ribosomal peptide maturation radical SAM protein 1
MTTGSAGRVALICMPFGFEYKPNLPLSQLKADLAAVGIESDVHYLNLRFAERIGARAYHDISVGRPSYLDLLGEWVFSSAIRPPDDAADRAYEAEILHRTTVDKRTPPDDGFVERVYRARAAVPDFLDDCLTTVPWNDYQLVVYVVPFLEQQLAAALALAARVAGRPGAPAQLIGGSGIEGASGPALLRAYPFLDATCSGEWDVAVPRFARELLDGVAEPAVPGISVGNHVRRLDDADWQRLAAAPPHADAVADLDSLPWPDYTDFFDAYESARFTKLRAAPAITFETSRGCWWGVKHHCTFCGLNQLNMAYRAKTPDRAVDEIVGQRDRYAGRFGRMEAKDTIMPMEYLRTVFPRLHERGIDARFFYEIKSNLKPDQLRLLAETGCTILQPGIECFSTPILRLMDKGVTALQNIQFLRQARRYDLQLIYNVLVGFPGEPEDEYEKQAALIPLITHLQPPGWWGRIHLDRFSPYFYRPADFGVTGMRPARAYQHVFPDLPDDLLGHVAFIFDFDAPGRDRIPAYTAPLLEEVRRWADVAADAFLTHTDDGTCLVVRDGRAPDRLERHELDGLARDVYLACEEPQSAARLAGRLSVDESHLRKALNDLADRRLLVAEDDRWLTLGLAADTASGKPDKERSS